MKAVFQRVSEASVTVDGNRKFFNPTEDKIIMEIDL
jgi:D-Tyr-tRNAtyr deacylase